MKVQAYGKSLVGKEVKLQENQSNILYLETEKGDVMIAEVISLPTDTESLLKVGDIVGIKGDNIRRLPNFSTNKVFIAPIEDVTSIITEEVE